MRRERPPHAAAGCLLSPFIVSVALSPVVGPTLCRRLAPPRPTPPQRAAKARGELTFTAVPVRCAACKGRRRAERERQNGAPPPPACAPALTHTPAPSPSPAKRRGGGLRRRRRGRLHPGDSAGDRNAREQRDGARRRESLTSASTYHISCSPPPGWPPGLHPHRANPRPASPGGQGVIQPVREIADLARARGAAVHTDAAQSVSKVPVKARELGVDLLTLVGHKFGAPKARLWRGVVGGNRLRRRRRWWDAPECPQAEPAGKPGPWAAGGGGAVRAAGHAPRELLPRGRAGGGVAGRDRERSPHRRCAPARPCLRARGRRPFCACAVAPLLPLSCRAARVSSHPHQPPLQAWGPRRRSRRLRRPRCGRT